MFQPILHLQTQSWENKKIKKAHLSVCGCGRDEPERKHYIHLWEWNPAHLRITILHNLFFMIPPHKTGLHNIHDSEADTNWNGCVLCSQPDCWWWMIDMWHWYRTCPLSAEFIGVDKSTHVLTVTSADTHTHTHTVEITTEQIMSVFYGQWVQLTS